MSDDANLSPAWAKEPLEIMARAGFERCGALEFRDHFRLWGEWLGQRNYFSKASPITAEEATWWVARVLNPGPIARVQGE